MAELMPANGEEFEWVDEQPCAGDIPEPKEHDGIHDYLFVRLENTEADGRVKVRETHDVEHRPLEGSGSCKGGNDGTGDLAPGRL
jgi:hypothetical protein